MPIWVEAEGLHRPGMFIPQRDVGKNHLLLFQASAEWLKDGKVNGSSRFVEARLLTAPGSLVLPLRNQARPQRPRCPDGALSLAGRGAPHRLPRRNLEPVHPPAAVLRNVDVAL